MSTNLFALVAAVTALGLVPLSLAPRPRTRLSWALAAGLIAVGAEAIVGYVLLAMTVSPAERMFWLRLQQAAGVVVPLPWGLLVMALLSQQPPATASRWRLTVAGTGVLAVVVGVAAAWSPGFEVADIPGDFHAARLDSVGASWVALQLLSTVGILAALELALRGANATSRWRIKYLVVGVGTIFLARFYFLSQTLLFHVVLGSYMTTQAAAVAIGNALVATALLRSRLRDVEFTVSRRVLYRSVLFGVLGLYLVAVGILGWLLNGLAIAEEFFWGSLAALVATVGIAVLFLSDDVRWRVRRFIDLNFYRHRYDYRQEWSSFTRRLGSLVTVDEIAPQVAAAMSGAVGSRRTLLFLVDGRQAAYQRVASVGVDRPFAPMSTDDPLVERLRRARTPTRLEADTVDGFGEASVAVPLLWRDTLIGFVLVGRERAGAEYAIEDLEFLATLGEQAAGALVTARLSEALAQTREFEAFHRLTSFVIHDIKNSISALSLLSENALANFDDPEFQRDAVKTVSRTVDRMTMLLSRLSSAPDSGALRLAPVSVPRLVREATAPVVGHRSIRLVLELAEVPPIQADGESLLQVLQNLVRNALDALDGRGSLTVRCYVDEGWTVVSVADTGCGMSDEYLSKHLFAPFRSTKKGGWGVGLYQARSIVEAHGGRIDVESKLGEGTTFWLRLRSAAPAPADTTR